MITGSEISRMWVYRVGHIIRQNTVKLGLEQKQMPDDPGNGIEQKALQEKLAVDLANTPAPPDNPHVSAGQSESHEEMKRDVREIDDRVKHAERWMIGLTFAIAFFALCSIVVGILQWDAMRGQLRQMQNASMEARESMDRSTESFRTDERAWVEIEPIKPILAAPRQVGFGTVFRYELYPRNAGKTVARNIVVKAQTSVANIDFGNHADFLRNGQDKLLLDKFTEGSSGKPVIIPRNPVPKVLAPNTASSVPFILAGQEPQVLPKSQIVSYLIGRIDYMDEFQITHWLKFCFFVANAKGDLWNCQEGNDEDHNPEIPPKKTN